MPTSSSIRPTLLVLALTILLLGCAPTETIDRTKVMIIGLDGLEWNILNPLIEQGRVPNFARLVSEGTSGYLMKGEENDSPILWTTIATGKPKEEHGILGFFKGEEGEVDRPPYTSADRRVAALWNIMGMEDRSVACFGWWCTWPAEQVNGVMVSAFAPWDPIAYMRRGLHAEREIANLTWPQSLMRSITPYMVDEDSITHEDLARFVNVDDWNHRMFNSDRVGPSVNYVLPWSIATDTSYVQIAEHLLQQRQYDLSMVYIQGTDTVGHKFWAFREGGDTLHQILTEYNLLPEEQATYERYFGDVIDNYYIFADELVGQLLATIDDKTVVIICSDHGMGPTAKPLEGRWEGHTFTGDHRDQGTIILWGPGIRAGKRLNDENPPVNLDVAPTVLAILGLPLAQDMMGTPILDAFDARFLQDYQPEIVESYDVNYQAGERPESIQMSGEYEERLRSLGYIQ